MRNYKRKTDRASVPKDIVLKAAERVLSGEGSLRDIANEYDGLSYSTLHRYVKKRRVASDANDVVFGYVRSGQVFSDSDELLLRDYVIKAAKLYHGLTPRELRSLAYEFAQVKHLKVPNNWSEKAEAGVDWLSGFVKRHPSISIRKPEATSLSRMTSFNKFNVEQFFNNLGSLLGKHLFQCSDIYNLDETGVTTVQRPAKILAPTGVKQVGGVTSGERGTLVTMCLAVSASGNMVPPMFVFPRVHFKDHFIRDGPPGCVGTAHKSGWMTEDGFLTFMEHFSRNVRPSLDHKVLLILDNHKSHISIRAIDFCRQNGIVLLAFPPHCSHKLQPLDRTVFGPFKRAVNVISDNWMKANPGKTMTIYDIPSIVRDALPIAGTPKNITSGFRVSGIVPFCPSVFGESDFLPSTVTDRPQQQVCEIPETVVSSSSKDNLPSDVAHPLAQESDKNPEEVTINSEELTADSPTCQATDHPEQETTEPGCSLSVTPEQIRPFRKAGNRKGVGNTRVRKRKSAILTDTPERNLIQQEEALRDERKGKAAKRKLLQTNTKRSKPKRKKKCKDTAETDDEQEWFCLVCVEPYSNSRPKERWIQCITCNGWSHAECTKNEGSPLYVCDNCESDVESD